MTYDKNLVGLKCGFCGRLATIWIEFDDIGAGSCAADADSLLDGLRAETVHPNSTPKVSTFVDGNLVKEVAC